MSKALANSLIALGDDHLILGHRLSQWCGHAPMLEEDLSMPNMALDLLGQARNLYTYAGELEGEGRTEDDLAYLRNDRDYKNVLLVERPNGDFAHTMLRQLYFAAYMQPFWQAASSGGGGGQDKTIAGFAAKAVKEIAYHIRHAGEWVVRLGDGTEESARRMADAVEALHIYTDELFTVTDDMSTCIQQGLLPDPESLRPQWQRTIQQIFDEALLTIPEVPFPQEGGRDGRHTEDFGHLLSELQYMQRAYPSMTW
jgi:ring-1,2-phenylacetyl-CoA epoxidase subunit PaaC